jgi:hypothetical protein
VQPFEILCYSLHFHHGQPTRRRSIFSGIDSID